MLRRGRSGRPRPSACSETRHVMDSQMMDSVMSIVAETEECQRQTTTLMSDESEVDHQVTSQVTSELTEAVIPSTLAPVLGESFCQCACGDDPNAIFGISTECLCGEDDDDFDWVWDQRVKSSGAFLSCDDRKVSFHSDYSCGTAAIRGTRELTEGQHFWEIKMTSPVYGTDMMVGIGTAEVNLEKFKYNFGSLLGHDEDSWGLSYTGLLQHKGEKVDFSSRFGQGSIIGLHLDTWHGTLTVYKNRRCVGVAATKLQNKKLYPMLCSTAAKSSMKVIRACYTPTSLQYLCCTRLRKILPTSADVPTVLELPPGLRSLLHRRFGWVFSITPTEGNPDPRSEPVLSACPTPVPKVCFEPSRSLPRSPTPSSSSSEDRLWPEDHQSKRCRLT
ncbi:SPRY domain-containing SOCS box protein 3 [Stigmatopora nigra]